MAEITLRHLTDSAEDVALGVELVHEYIVATAEEQAGPDEKPDVERILPYMPDVEPADFVTRFLRGGAFIVATVDSHVAACVGVAPYRDGECEMNRLWVREPFRSHGLGRRLAQASVDAATELGFSRMLLDVLPIRTRAIGIYHSMGFTDVEPHHEYAFPVVAMARELAATDR